MDVKSLIIKKSEKGTFRNLIDVEHKSAAAQCFSNVDAWTTINDLVPILFVLGRG
jgi:hypothetical protein